MTDLVLASFEEEHLANFDPKDPYPPGALHEAIQSSLGTHRFIFLTIMNRTTHETLALCSLFLLAEGTAEVILIPSKKFKDYKLGVFKILHSAMDGWVQKEFQLHRLQMSISTAWGGGIKWARLLGFKFEGIMRGYGTDKQDHALFAKVV